MSEDKLAAARRAKAHFQETISKDVDVVGIGIGLIGSEPGLKVNLGAEPANRNALPRELDGVPIVYDVVGKIRSRASP